MVKRVSNGRIKERQRENIQGVSKYVCSRYHNNEGNLCTRMSFEAYFSDYSSTFSVSF